ncbi:MAG TPA: PepSY-associated TM helix domain-containing protein [Pyrinomonadaceae bacterium]|nr:PepSY-associated TM helix domain-containing protein [Pyrinomonadaceae bacterium]
MNTFRRIIFWTHFAIGLTLGLIIVVLCVSGALLAFERQLIELADGDLKTSKNTDSSNKKFTVSELVSKLNEKEIKPSSLTITNNAQSRIQVTAGQGAVFYLDQSSGEIFEAGKNIRQAMQTLRELHRYLSLSGESRAVGKAATGAANLVFIFIIITGLYLWLPRVWSKKHLRPIIWFRKTKTSRARDFNWHNVIGIWAAVPLLVMAVTATVISYRWASDLLMWISGENVEAASQNNPRQNENDKQKAKPDYTSRIDEVISVSKAAVTDWQSMTIRLPLGETTDVSIDEGIYWNRFGRSTLTVNTSERKVLKWSPYGERGLGTQLRSWFRFTHTGESFGIIGQFIAFLGCIGGAILGYTGIALAIRRIKGMLPSNKTIGFSETPDRVKQVQPEP